MPLDQSYINRKVKLVSEIYQHDLQFRIHEIEPKMKITPCSGGFSGGKRGKIKKFSKKAVSRFRKALRNTADYWTHEATLTYAFDYPTDGRIVKLHMKKFIETIQRKYPSIYWVWRLEFQQERGRKGLGYAPHFHLMFNQFVCKNWLAATWARIVNSSDANHKEAGTRISKIRKKKEYMNYISKYLSKDSQSEVPEGFEEVGGFWGMKRGIVEREEIKEIGTFRDITRDLRLAKRWTKAEYRSWQKGRLKKGLPYRKWKGPFTGKGFLAIGGRRFFDYMKLRI